MCILADTHTKTFWVRKEPLLTERTGEICEAVKGKLTLFTIWWARYTKPILVGEEEWSAGGVAPRTTI